MKQLIYALLLVASAIHCHGQNNFYISTDMGLNNSSNLKYFEVRIPTENTTQSSYYHKMKFPTHLGRINTLSMGYKKDKYAIELEYLFSPNMRSQSSEHSTLRQGFFPPFSEPDSFSRHYLSQTRFESINLQGRHFLRQGKCSPYLSGGINFSIRQLHYSFDEELESEINHISIQLYDKTSLGYNLNLGADLHITDRLTSYLQGGFTHTLYSPAEMDIQVFRVDKTDDSFSIEHSKQRFQLTRDNSTKQISTLLFNARIGLRFNFKNKKS